MIASILSVVAALTGQNVDSVKPKVDRSGEAAFRALLEEIGAKKRYHGMIIKSFKEAGKEDYYPEGLVEVWRDNGKFRIEFGDMWGTSSIVVSNGKQVLEDLGADPVTVKQPGKSLVETSESLMSEGSASSPWHYLVEGVALLDRMDKDRAITSGPKPNSIVWDSSLFGKLTLTKTQSDQEMEVWEIEFNNLPWQEKMFQASPEWFDRPDPSANWRQKVVLTQDVKFPKDVFETKPGRGRAVVDLTLKKNP